MKRKSILFSRLYVAPSALRTFLDAYLGRCPRLLHVAPLALKIFEFSCSSIVAHGQRCVSRPSSDSAESSAQLFVSIFRKIPQTVAAGWVPHNPPQIDGPGS